MKRLAIAALLIFACGNIQAQSGVPDSVLPPITVPSDLDIGGSGARARGMGGAFIATGDDASALTWNPAGLYSIDKTTMTMGFDRFSVGGKVESGPLSVAQTGSFSGPGFFSLVSPFRIKNHGFVGGLSYARTTDEAFNSASDVVTLIDPDGSVTTYPLTEYFLSLRTAYHAQFTPVTVGFGTRLSERMAAGLSINVITGKSVSVFTRRDVAEDFFVPTYYPQPADYELDGRVYDSSKLSGVFFNLGLKYVQPRLSLGLVLKSPYSLRQETNRTIRAVTYVNGFPQREGTVVQFIDGKIVSLEMPFMVGFGGSLKTDSTTTFALDVEYRPFSGKKLKVRDLLVILPGAKDEEYFHYEDPQWRNVLIVRAGVEKQFSTGSPLFPVVPMRLGFGYVPTPAPNLTGDIASGTASAINLSLGTGVKWAQAQFDVAYTYRSLKRTFEEVWGTTELKGKSHFMYFTFTGYF